MSNKLTLDEYNTQHFAGTAVQFKKNVTKVALIIGESFDGKLDMVMAAHLQENSLLARKILKQVIEGLEQAMLNQ